MADPSAELTSAIRMMSAYSSLTKATASLGCPKHLRDTSSHAAWLDTVGIFQPPDPVGPGVPARTCGASIPIHLSRSRSLAN